MFYVALRAVDSLKTIFTPFLPHTSQTVHELLGYEGWIAGPLDSATVDEEDGRTHEVLTGDYAGLGRQLGSRASSRPARHCGEPRPLFKKLDDSVVDDELRSAPR